jgi:type VI secretion system secreted protein VgrG
MSTMFATVTTFGAGAPSLMLARMSGHEALGEPFSYELDLISTDDDLDLAAVLGESLTVELEIIGGKKRFFNGKVVRFARTGTMGRHILYHATVRPWLWLLTQYTDCRVFHDLSVPDVLMQVFRDYGFSDVDRRLHGEYRSWEYLVQYRESAFNFVSRLMEQEGIYYYFTHGEAQHHLVLADSLAAHENAPGYDKVPYYPPGHTEQRSRDHIDDWQITHHLKPKSYFLRDFDFKKPKSNIDAIALNPDAHRGAIYDYPGEYTQREHGVAYAQRRMEQLASEQATVKAEGNTRGIGAGHKFELTGFTRADQNRSYLVTRNAFHFDLGAYESTTGRAHEPTFHCTLSAIPDVTPFRASLRTPKPSIHGAQTAIVVGQDGHDFTTEPYGRVKIQFHWDRRTKSELKGELSSWCWARVSQLLAGAGFGAQFIPRIGQEVVVEFLEGDPDQPVVTGCLYNADNKPPYPLDINQTRSGIKTRSSLNGPPDQFNELRFEDKLGAEELFIQAERDFTTNVKHDTTGTVGHDHVHTVNNDLTLTVNGGEMQTDVPNGNYFVDAHTMKFTVNASTVTITPTSIELSSSGSTIVLNAGGVSINGAFVKLNS